VSDTPSRGFRPVDPAELGIEPKNVTIDTTIAHPARVYDYLLGGKDNFTPDREVAEQLVTDVPDVRDLARRNRDFVNRAARYLVADLGIRQIIDVGTGIPTSPAVHEIARAIAPDVTVAYVDNDPIVLAHDRALLSREDGVVTFIGDLRDPSSVLEQPELRELIDFDRPVAVLFAAVFQFVTDDQDPKGIIDAYRSQMVSGSAMALSHPSTSHRSPAAVRKLLAAYRTSAPLVFRDDTAITGFFDGFAVQPPGIVPLHRWRPDADGQPTTGGDWGSAGVGILE